MHKEAHDWLAQFQGWTYGLNLGGRDAGDCSISDLFHFSTVVDLQPGPGVNVIGDITDPDLLSGHWPLAVCAEVLEHVSQPDVVIDNAYKWLSDGGVLLITAAGEGRVPHSCIRPGLPLEGEWYQNINAVDLWDWLVMAGFTSVEVSTNPDHCDVYAKAIK